MRKMTAGMFCSLAMVLGGVWMVQAAETAPVATVPAQADISPYMIETTHTADQCKALMAEVSTNQNLQGRTWFACEGAQHRGWSVVRADSAEAALKMIPESLRKGAKASKVSRVGGGNWEGHKKNP